MRELDTKAIDKTRHRHHTGVQKLLDAGRQFQTAIKSAVIDNQLTIDGSELWYATGISAEINYTYTVFRFMPNTRSPRTTFAEAN